MKIGNSKISLTLNVDQGVLLEQIRDEAAGRDYLDAPGMLFEFASNNRPEQQSNRDLLVESATLSHDRAQLTIIARALHDPLAFVISMNAELDAPAVVYGIQVTNTGNSSVFLRMVTPKIRRLVTPGPQSGRMGALPRELGSVVPIGNSAFLGMELNMPVGLPTAMNSMEVVSIYDADGSGGVFFADVDGDVDNGVPPIQLTLSNIEVAGFFVAQLNAGASARTSRLAIGVHSDGDWHAGVDYYISKHRSRWQFPNVPSWFRDQGAIYAPSGFGAGGIYLALPAASLGDGIPWVTFSVNDGAWHDLVDGRGHPPGVGPAGFAPPGASLAVATQRGERQLDVFMVGNDGAVWVTFTVDDGAWTDGIGGRTPMRVSPSGFAQPGAPLAVAAQRGGRQMSVFTVGNEDAVWVTFTVDDGPWTDGIDGRTPMRVSPTGFARRGTPLAVATQRGGRQLDVFTVGNDGAIWVTFTVDDGAWTDGIDGRMPVRVSPIGFVQPGAALAVGNQRGGRQLDVFTVRDDGAVWVTFTVDDGPWTDGIDGRTPMRVSPAYVQGQLLPPGSHMAVANQLNGKQLDVFSVGKGLIKSFRELPRFLEEAKAFGTNIVYLVDYWEGATKGGEPRYWNKGDYIPRADLGGEAALIEGIRKIREDGGRVILYLEPFIIYEHSRVAQQHGDSWRARLPSGLWGGDGSVHRQYLANLTMAAPSAAWQNYVIDVAKRLIRDYFADGIFLDSWAWQMNWPMRTLQDGVPWSPLEYSQGVLNLAARVRRAVKEINADAVVLGETTAGPIGRYWDGGLSANFGFAERPENPRRLIASPVRYGIPELNWFGNGTNLNELHQVFAAGNSLALCGFWPGSFMHDAAGHIRTLVQMRQTYKDALIYGQQTYQPRTGNEDVVAYRYRGETHQLITLVNIADTVDHVVTLALRDDDRDSTWTDLLAPLLVSANGNLLGPISVPRSGLRVLLRSVD